MRLAARSRSRPFHAMRSGDDDIRREVLEQQNSPGCHLVRVAWEKSYSIDYASSSMAVWRMYKEIQEDSSKSLGGVVVMWTRSQVQFEVASLSKWPGFLLPVSRNLGRPDWPIAGQPSRGQRNAVFGLWKGTKSAPQDLLPITEPDPWLCPYCVILGSTRGSKDDSCMWNPRHQQEARVGQAMAVNRDGKSNGMAAQHSRHHQ